MSYLRDLYNALFARLDGPPHDWVLPTLARFTFAATLLFFFWYSALTKPGTGPFGFLVPSSGAYGSILPWRAEAVGYDVSQLTFWDTAVVLLGMWAEFTLPLLIVLGLFTRAAALAMIFFCAVLTSVDIWGFHVDDKTFGAWFDGKAGSIIMDQRLFWLLLLVTLVLKGGGPLSLDRLLRLR